MILWLLLLIQPIVGYMGSEPAESVPMAICQDIWRQIPIVEYLEETREYAYASQSAEPYTSEELIRMAQEENAKKKEEGTEQETAPEQDVDETQSTEATVEEESSWALEEAAQMTDASVLYMEEASFVPAQEKARGYSKEELMDVGFVKKTFYTVDATTQIKESQLAYDKLMGFDATIKQDNSKPQILIYHTHSQEGYADSDLTRAETTIMGVGEYLTRILTDQYGFHVIHHLGQYDVKSRDYAYTEAAKGVEAVLAEYPSIEVVIDLHRDAVPEDTKLLTTVQGREVAKFMFFNGLSYTQGLGELTSLPNPYVQDNLSFAFQMNLAAQEYYPDITRKIYLKGYRYNMHYRAKSLLVELGAQTNTVEEAMNACEPLAHVIAMVLKGEA